MGIESFLLVCGFFSQSIFTLTLLKLPVSNLQINGTVRDIAKTTLYSSEKTREYFICDKKDTFLATYSKCALLIRLKCHT